MAQLTDVGCGLLVVWKRCKMFTGGYDVAKLRVAWLINIMLLLFFVALLLWDILSYYGEIPFAQVSANLNPNPNPNPNPNSNPNPDPNPDPNPNQAPSTPMHEEPAVELLPAGVQVRLKAGGLKGAIVAVVEAEAAYDVAMSDSAKTERVAHAEVEVVQPGKKEKLVIISGEHKGSTGVLIGIDGLDGIVKMQANGDIKILDLQSCAKLN